MTPKERLKEIYDEYLTEQDKYLNFKDWIEDTDIYTYTQLSLNCGFSTTPECRKAINELQNPNKHLEDSLNAIDKAIKENPEKVRKIAENVKQNWQSVSDKITESTKNSRYSVYIPESAKKSKKQETWQDILDGWVNNGVEEDDYAINFLNYLKDNFEVPKRK